MDCPFFHHDLRFEVVQVEQHMKRNGVIVWLQIVMKWLDDLHQVLHYDLRLVDDHRQREIVGKLMLDIGVDVRNLCLNGGSSQGVETLLERWDIQEYDEHYDVDDYWINHDRLEEMSGYVMDVIEEPSCGLILP